MCPDCLQEANAQKTSSLKRFDQIEALPCSKHGHPGWLTPRLQAWVEFFSIVAPYGTDTTLDHALVSKICEAYGLDFCEAFEQLTWILEIWRHARQGIQRSSAENTNPIQSVTKPQNLSAGQ